MLLNQSSFQVGYRKRLQRTTRRISSLSRLSSATRRFRWNNYSPGGAGIAPSATTQFSLSPNPGGTQTWYVNNIAGGNSSVGTISSSGLYTAPDSTSPLTVEVTAGSSAQSGYTTSAVSVYVIPAGVAVKLLKLSGVRCLSPNARCVAIVSPQWYGILGAANAGIREAYSRIEIIGSQNSVAGLFSY